LAEDFFRVRKGLTVANSSASANLDPLTLTIGSTTVNSTVVSVVTIALGNATANVVANSIVISVANSTSTANLNPLALTIGTTVVNASSVNAAALYVGGAAVWVPGGTDIAIADGGTGQSTAVLAFGALKQAANDTVTGVIEQATLAEVRAATAGNLAVTPALIETASADVALSDAATIAVDWDTGINFTVTLTTSRILGNPTNGQPGTWRTVLVTQPVAGTAVLTFGNQYKFAGGTVPIIGTGNGALSRLAIYCRTASIFEAYMTGAGIA
jgi:hypothetical protein